MKLQVGYKFKSNGINYIFFGRTGRQVTLEFCNMKKIPYLLCFSPRVFYDHPLQMICCYKAHYYVRK